MGWRAVTSWMPAEPEWWVLVAAWFANPAIWVAILAAGCGRWRMAQVAAGCGLALSLPVLTRYGGMVGGYPGYWAWVGSAVIVAVASELAAGRQAHLARGR
ncbi:MAG TPA: hypothetical protein VGF55_05865 [Gemmataceae bacterium]